MNLGENMRDTDSLVKKLKIVLIAILIAIVLFPIIIHILFKFKSNCYWITAEWKIGDILGYGGAALTAIGISLLGLTTLIVQKRTEENNQLLQNHPQIEVSKIEVNSSLCELVKSYNTDNPFTHALTVKRPCFESSSEVRYREFYIICKNIHGVEPNSVKLVSNHCNISFNNGRRRGDSLVKYKMTSVSDDEKILFSNCKSLNVVSENYINIDAASIDTTNNLYFKFPVIILYDENDDEFIEDINDSISKNTYGLTLTLRFKNNLGYFEESVYTFLSSQIFNKTGTYFGKENSQSTKHNKKGINNKKENNDSNCGV